MLTVLTSAVGCATGPSFGKYLSNLRASAGPGAQACGVVRLGEAAADAVSCANHALARHEAFWVTFQVMGIDSRIFLGLTGDTHGRSWSINWDSDASGGYALFTPRQEQKTLCESPRIVEGESGVRVRCQRE
jgi:hypothetical protein